MKILYGIPAVGYGHVVRSKTIIDELRKFAEVDILLSGSGFGMEDSIGLTGTIYRKKGVSLEFSSKGKLNLMDTLLKSSVARLVKESLEIDLSGYDLVISDAELLTCVAAKTQKVKCLGISNIYSYLNHPNNVIYKLSRPIREAVLKFVGGDENITVFYEALDENTILPILSKEILNAANNTTDEGHITVYLGTVNPDLLSRTLKKITQYNFDVFCPKITEEYSDKNLRYKLRNPDNFVKSFMSCHGFITGAGFTATSEALFLGKKLMVIPVNHIEQKYNAHYLKMNGIKVVKNINKNFIVEFDDWEQNYQPIKKDYDNVLPELMTRINKFYSEPVKNNKLFNISPFELLKYIKYLY